MPTTTTRRWANAREATKEIADEIRRGHQTRGRAVRVVWREDAGDWIRSQMATLNGWKVASREFSVRNLREGKRHDGGRRYPECTSWGGWYDDINIHDHREHYRGPDGIPAALIAHPYGGREAVTAAAEAWAMANELVVHVCPSASWWYPNSTTAIAFTRPGAVVVWPDTGPDGDYPEEPE